MKKILLKGLREKQTFGNVILDLWNAIKGVKQQMQTVVEWLGNEL